VHIAKTPEHLKDEPLVVLRLEVVVELYDLHAKHNGG
jgi:hypothetical protein